MSFAYGHIAQRLFDTPLMYDPRKAEAFVNGLGGRIAGGEVVITNAGGAIDHIAGGPHAGRIGDFFGRREARWGGQSLYVENGIAIIPVEGTLVHKGSFVGQSSGLTSYEGLQAQITLAARSDAVRGVAFEFDSYGGEVSGGFETAQMIATLSKAKPTIAILTDFAYSAAYLQASQTRQIIAPEFGGAGSIGVIMLHADYSRQLANEGVDVTIIRSGTRKAEGNPYEPLPADLANRWQAQVDAIREKFASVVGKGRGSRFSAAKALKTEAEAYDASAALSLGIIDAVADPAEAFEAFAKAVNKG